MSLRCPAALPRSVATDQLSASTRLSVPPHPLRAHGWAERKRENSPAGEERRGLDEGECSRRVHAGVDVRRTRLTLRPDVVTSAGPVIDSPTLLIWGDRDLISPVSVGEHLDSLLPDSHLVVLPGAAHLAGPRQTGRGRRPGHRSPQRRSSAAARSWRRAGRGSSTIGRRHRPPPPLKMSDHVTHDLQGRRAHRGSRRGQIRACLPTLVRLPVSESATRDRGSGWVTASPRSGAAR